MYRGFAFWSVVLAVGALGTVGMASELKVGVGRAIITPEQDMWMAGYASRKAPSDGKLHDLWAKALAVQDATGARSVMITTDLIGVSAPLSKSVAELAQAEFGIPRERVMITASHTHSGPVARDNLISMYELDDEQTRLLNAYTAALPGLLMDAVRGAIADLESGTLHWGNGHADFARNRREYTENGVINRINPIGPVDHDVPILAVRRADGSLKGLLFGYACHNTCLSIHQFSGDYAGFAQLYVEAQQPGVTALFVSGCGGDQNPLPRRTVTLAETYGEMLGKAVLAAADSSMTELPDTLRAAYEEISLGLTEPPSREEVQQQLEDDNVYVRRRAESLLEQFERNGALATTYPYPVQVWQFGDALQITALGGEVVVDYSLRIKQEYGRERNFVIGYANDVCAYIPSLRVLREGGYEGGGAMLYYGFYGPWAPPIERDIMASVHRLSAKRQLIDLYDVEAVRERRPVLIAHRGGVVASGAPECSRAGMRLASSAGYTMLELDVQESKDGEPVVFHDRTLQKACGVDGAVRDYTSAELMNTRLLGTDETIQHLQEALAFCKAENLGVMLDIKSQGSQAFFRGVLGHLERLGLLKATLCINGAEDVRENLGEHIMLRVFDDELEAFAADPSMDLSGKYWFGQAAHLESDLVPKLQAAGALVLPGVNVFRYAEATHRADAKADIERLTAAGADGFQIDSAYQDYFGIAAVSE
jgi:hypothetical protein